MRTYYCICGNKAEAIPGKLTECECGKVFGSTGKVSDHINMRNTWSGQTKVEFSQTTMDADIAERNKR